MVDEFEMLGFDDAPAEVGETIGSEQPSDVVAETLIVTHPGAEFTL